MSVDEHILAERLCAEVGLQKPLDVERLAGGKNNQVFRVRLAEGPDVVLKRYFHDARDARDRLKAEWEFLLHARACGVRAIPRPLASDPAEHAGLYTFLKGDKLRASDVTTAHVDAASTFIYEINHGGLRLAGGIEMPPELGLASEACLSMSQHLATVDRRIDRLSRLADDAPYREEAERFVAERLRPVWSKVREGIVLGAMKAGIALDQQIHEREIIVSPSDFGFHNVLVRPDGVLQFIDFEYAGRDDFAKLAGDFYACPEIPTPQDTFERFLDRLIRLLEFPETARTRARLLRDAYRVKWACIILNDFLPSDDARRAFAGGEERAARCKAQLAKAEAKIAEIPGFGGVS